MLVFGQVWLIARRRKGFAFRCKEFVLEYKASLIAAGFKRFIKNIQPISVGI